MTKYDWSSKRHEIENKQSYETDLLCQAKSQWAWDVGMVREQCSQSKKQEDKEITKDTKQTRKIWMAEMTSQKHMQSY